MQQKKDRKADFLHKFDLFIKQSGSSISSACEQIGMSRSYFYAVKDRDQTPSEKIVRLLDAALDSAERKEPSPYLSGDREVPVVSGKGFPLTRGDLNVMIGEIRLRLDLLQSWVNSIDEENLN